RTGPLAGLCPAAAIALAVARPDCPAACHAGTRHPGGDRRPGANRARTDPIVPSSTNGPPMSAPHAGESGTGDPVRTGGRTGASTGIGRTFGAWVILAALAVALAGTVTTVALVFTPA